MSVNVGTATGYLDLDISGFLTGLKSANSEATKEINNLSTNIGKGFEAAGSKLTSAGKTLTKGITVPLTAAAASAIKTGIEFESAFAGVRKTIDATEKEFEGLSTGIKEMSKVMPQSASDIAAVAEAAGQLGIKTENVLGFTKTMVMLGDSTNMSSDEAATALARLANITQMPQTEFDKLGSVIVSLGNNLATTEREITDMGLNLAAAGSQVGMSEAEVLGFAGALSSVGIEAAAGGTAFSKVMVDMQLATELGGEELTKFADVAGMSADQFKVKFKQDAAGALTDFIKGLQTTEEKGMSAIAVLDDMGIVEVRMRDALLRAAGAGDLFADSIDLATNAWSENVALQAEAEQRYQTTESQLSMLRNKFSLIGITLADTLIPMLMNLADSLGKVADWFASLNPETQESIVKWGIFAAAIGPVLLVLGKVASAIGGIIGVVGTVAGAIGVVTTGAAAATPAIGALATAFTVLTGPVGLIIAGVAALAVGTIALVKHLRKDSIPAVELFGDGISEATEKAVGGFLELNDEATLSLKELSWSGQTVTEEMADNIVGNFSKMSEQIQTELADQHTESLSKMKIFLANSESLSEEEQETTLNNMIEGYEKKKQTVIDGEARIKKIMDLASAEKRGLTKAEQSEINEIQTAMVETGIKVLSDSEVESKLIMERMKEQAGEMSALQAAEVVKNSLEQKEGAVKAAEEQYDEVIREIIRQRDEAGIISEEQAQKLIDEAKRQRDEVINNAEKMHNDVIAEAKAQAGEHVNQVDWTTGEIKSKWEILKEDTVKTFDEIGKSISNTWNNVKESTTNTWNNIKTKISNIIDNIKSTFSSGFDAVKSTVKSKFDSIKSKIKSVMDGAKNIVSSAIDKIKSFFDFSWSLPELKLPHFKISGEFSLNPPSVPSFGIEWYKKAMGGGMILDSPTIFGFNSKTGKFLAGGEAGSEIVVGTKSLMHLIKTAVNESNTKMQSTSHSKNDIKIDINVNANVANDYDVRSLANELGVSVERELRSKGVAAI